MSEWNGQSLYDHVHPEDIVKVREQLSLTENQHPSKLI